MSSKNDKKNNKDIKVVSGNADELDISPVYTHINISKPNVNKKSDKKIVIPDEKKNEKK